MNPKDYIKEAFKRGRIHHSLLIEGEGEEEARYLVKILNCLSEDPPCEECRVCRAVNAGLHPDFITVEPARSIKIDQIREIISLASLEPVAGRHRVVFIKEAEKMTPEAANAFLKVLEEPPPSTYFLLATSNPSALPATILSRCLYLKGEEEEQQNERLGSEIFSSLENLGAFLEVVRKREALAEVVETAITYLQGWLARKARGEEVELFSRQWKERAVMEVLEQLWFLRSSLEQPVNLNIAKEHFLSCVEKLLSF